eukprot:3018772-Rhodomonas_salina.1
MLQLDDGTVAGFERAVANGGGGHLDDRLELGAKGPLVGGCGGSVEQEDLLHQPLLDVGEELGAGRVRVGRGVRGADDEGVEHAVEARRKVVHLLRLRLREPPRKRLAPHPDALQPPPPTLSVRPPLLGRRRGAGQGTAVLSSLVSKAFLRALCLAFCVLRTRRPHGWRSRRGPRPP